jgi:hypothetical protein
LKTERKCNYTELPRIQRSYYDYAIKESIDKEEEDQQNARIRFVSDINPISMDPTSDQILM